MWYYDLRNSIYRDIIFVRILIFPIDITKTLNMYFTRIQNKKQSQHLMFINKVLYIKDITFVLNDSPFWQGSKNSAKKKTTLYTTSG